MVQKFNESLINFQFPNDWAVLPLDKHRFYSYVSGLGLKGVDFISIENNSILHLTEVKNYKNRHDQDAGLELIESPEPYAQKMIQKFEDSIQLIRVAQQYYDRKLWYRLIKRWILRNPTPKKGDHHFWTTANAILESSEQSIRFYLVVASNDNWPSSTQQEATAKVQIAFDQYFQNKQPKAQIICIDRLSFEFPV